MKSLSLPRDYRDFVRLLKANEVEFLLVGAYAVAVHGRVRATGDIDFMYRATAANVERLCVAMRTFGAPDWLIDPAFLARSGSVTQIGYPPNRIDLLESITAVTFERAWERAKEASVDGELMRVIGLDDLLANKRATGRSKDRKDAIVLSARHKK